MVHYEFLVILDTYKSAPRRKIQNTIIWGRILYDRLRWFFNLMLLARSWCIRSQSIWLAESAFLEASISKPVRALDIGSRWMALMSYRINNRYISPIKKFYQVQCDIQTGWNESSLMERNEISRNKSDRLYPVDHIKHLILIHSFFSPI